MTWKKAGQAFVLLLAVAAIYRAYKRWKAYKAMRKMVGKVVLITGASSGLGEGLLYEYDTVYVWVWLSIMNVVGFLHYSFG